MDTCTTCGMHTDKTEYHPHAACLMYKACNDAEEVRANLADVRGDTVVYTNSDSLEQIKLGFEGKFRRASNSEFNIELRC